MRLLDKVRVNGLANDFELVPRMEGGQGSDHLPAFLVDGSINHYIPTLLGIGERKDSPLYDFPNIAPPYPRFFMEGKVWSENQEQMDSYQIGAFVEYRDFSRSSLQQKRNEVDSHSGKWTGLSEGYYRLLPEGRWLVLVTILTDARGVTPSYKRPMVLGKAMALVREDGSIAQDEVQTGFSIIPGDFWLTHYDKTCKSEDHFLEQIDFIKGHITRRAFCMLFSISLMHCRNILEVPVEVPVKMQRSFNKKYKVPRVKYRVLEIDPAKTKGRRVSTDVATDIKQAFHLCRGHFKHYVPERGGPFGRAISEPYTMWVPAHAKGNIREGAVQKDYRVLAP